MVLTKGGWDGARFYLDGGGICGIGSATHWAILEGPEPCDDISLNWRLWQGSHGDD